MVAGLCALLPAGRLEQWLSNSSTPNEEKTMRVLVGCEFSGAVREAFRKRGHDAWSCDLLDAEDESQFHIKGDLLQVLNNGWDLAVFHPPCTHLAVSGARWFKDKVNEQKEALEFVRILLNAPIKQIALENPISIISSRIRKPDQIIQPLLVPTNLVEGRQARVHRLPPSPDRWKERSRTYPGIAAAMAQQWG